ncbi:MAG TPA: DUF1015 domain-containing protein [Phycisphaerales bacterium]|nr:DUF1015 domain-containing protein [Phycisphaerales bacterium]
MLRIKPLSVLRPPAELAPAVACVPYDVVNTQEARALAAGNPRSFLHVIRPDIDLPDEVDHHADIVYDTAKSAFERFQRDATLTRDPQPAIYLYRQEMSLLGRRVSQTGVVCGCHTDDYNSGLIKKHEKTRKDKEDDRTRHVLTLSANAEPVFFLFKDDAAIGALIRADTAGTALYDFTAPDGVRHTVWRAAPERAPLYTRAFGALPCAYVADGHHRTASAARAGAERRAANPRHTGAEEYNWFLAVLFPAFALTILPYHRTVADLNGLTPEAVLKKIGAGARVTPDASPEPASPGSVSMYIAGRWHGIAFPTESISRADPVRSLDSVILTERILQPILGIGDIRTDTRIDFVGGIRGPDELRRRVDEGRAAIAFSMHAVTIEQLIAISDAGEIMPPKSTWFEPKLRSGLFVHTLD